LRIAEKQDGPVRVDYVERTNRALALEQRAIDWFFTTWLPQSG